MAVTESLCVAKALNIGQHSTSLARTLVELCTGRPGFVYATMEDNREAFDVGNAIHVWVVLLVPVCVNVLAVDGQLAKLAGLVAILAQRPAFRCLEVSTATGLCVAFSLASAKSRARSSSLVLGGTAAAVGWVVVAASVGASAVGSVCLCGGGCPLLVDVPEEIGTTVGAELVILHATQEDAPLDRPFLLSNRDGAFEITGGELRFSVVATEEAEEAARVGGVIHGHDIGVFSVLVFSPQLGTDEGEAQDREEEDSLHV